MKTITIITGNTGVGKSTVAQKLMHSVPNSGWFDDQSWKTNPLSDLKTRMTGVATMCAAAADTYFDAGLNHVFLSGVLPGDFHFERIQSFMSTPDVKLNAFWLTCETEANRQRLIGRDGHEHALIDVSEYLEDGKAVPIDTTSATADEVVKTILTLIKQDG